LEKGYGCAIYEITRAPDGTAQVALLYAKARVMPNEMLKQALKDKENHNGSIPRLELNAACCAVECAEL
jgi:hypothetical protein